MDIKMIFISLILLLSFKYNVYASIQEYSTGSRNYAGCANTCKDYGGVLATKDQILFFLDGYKVPGESWTPVADDDNEWLTIGSSKWPYGDLYTSISGGYKPRWGSKVRSRGFKDYFYCYFGGAEGGDKVTPAPTTPAPTTTTEAPEPIIDPLPGVDCCANRCRKSWDSLSQSERNVYISGFKQLADKGVIQELSYSHFASAEHSGWKGSTFFSNEYFLPWHRVFILMLEDEIRALGPDYECFGMPFWDWSDEPTPKEVKNGKTLLIMNSGIGDDSDGSCQNSGSSFDAGSYQPQLAQYKDNSGNKCLMRNVDYTTNQDGTGWCWFDTPNQILDMIGRTTKYSVFAGQLEGAPHAAPHVCISGNMETFYSPDDPAFYLHHTFVDYIWALWQDCNDYEGSTTSAAFSGNIYAALEYAPYTTKTYTTRDVIDLEEIGVIYDKGPLFSNIEGGVENDVDCKHTVNPNWFRDFLGRRRRLKRGNGKRKAKRQHSRGTGRKKRIRFKPFRKLQRAMRQRLRQEEELEIEVEECTNDRNACPIPDNFDDCSSLTDDEVNALTIQDMISMDGINNCQKAFREGVYEWAKEMNYLRALCKGCLDPVCDRDLLFEKCAVGGN